MARRNLLHRNKLLEFNYFLIANGYSPVENAAAFEVLRWKVKGSPMPIVFNGKSKQHLSCNEAAVPFIKMFINQGDSK
tara:strand:- start:370 stop:603 length:234 start_codon:yes stop_codon:yes gene_type:complete